MDEIFGSLFALIYSDINVFYLLQIIDRNMVNILGSGSKILILFSVVTKI